MAARPAVAAISLGCALSALAAAGCDVQVPVLSAPGCGTTWPPEPARAADAVVSSLLVAVYLGDIASPANEMAMTKSLLTMLGVRRVMDPTLPEMSTLLELGSVGVRVQLWLQGPGTYHDQIIAALPTTDVIDSIQIDPLHVRPSFKPPDGWLAERRSYCDRVFRDAKTARPGVTVIGPDFLLPAGVEAVDFGPCIDYGTVHRSWNRRPPGVGTDLDDLLAAHRPRSARRPLILGMDSYITEAGDPDRVSEIVQAKYVMRLIFESFNRELQRVFLGDLKDFAPDENDTTGGAVIPVTPAGEESRKNQGLFHFNGTPKPAFTAVRNLIALLADPGDLFTTGGLAYRIDGATAALHHSLLQRRDGTFFLALWLETASTDVDATLPLTVRFPSPIKQVSVFVPQNSTTATMTASGVSQMIIPATDHITLLQVTPCGR